MAEVTLDSLETKVYIIKIRLADSLIKNWIDTRLIKEGHFEISKLLEKYPNTSLVTDGYEKSSGTFYLLLLSTHDLKYEDVKSAVNEDLVRIMNKIEGK